MTGELTIGMLALIGGSIFIMAVIGALATNPYKNQKKRIVDSFNDLGDEDEGEEDDAYDDEEMPVSYVDGVPNIDRHRFEENYIRRTPKYKIKATRQMPRKNKTLPRDRK